MKSESTYRDIVDGGVSYRILSWGGGGGAGGIPEAVTCASLKHKLLEGLGA